jgi:glucosyl-dolichyl phosphate glucuronosyltransferase
MQMAKLNLDIADSLKPKISIIIPTYNRATTLGLTLDSLIGQDYPSDRYEIIVVDNASTDETAAVVQGFVANARNIPVFYLFEPKQGVHYARNNGAKISRHELLYYTDDDVVAEPRMLSEIIKPFVFDAEVGTATGRVLPRWEVPPPDWVTALCYNSLLSILDPVEEFVVAKEIPMLYSCHQALRRDVFFQAGGFNPENTKGVWIGDGETGLNIKIRKLGYKFGFNGGSIIYHIIPQSRMTQAYLNKRIGNSGNCHAFTAYREKTPGKAKLVCSALKRTCGSAPVRLTLYLLTMINEGNLQYWRFIVAHLFYYLNWLKFDFKLATNAKFREFVTREDFMDDHEIVF